jgi:release factor glutamine methyltransferase
VRLVDLFQQGRRSLPTANPALDAEVLLLAAFGISRDRFWLDREREVAPGPGLRRYRRWLARRRRHEPVAYILGRKEFFGLDFRVDRRVLIPRPETELLVEEALQRLPPGGRVLDIGAGSGNISVAMARGGARVTAVEASPAARRVLRRNLAAHGVGDRVRVSAADLFPRGACRYDLVVSNPPYVASGEWPALPPGVRLWEPRQALVAGPRGWETLARIIAAAVDRLVPGGWLLLEMGGRQRRTLESCLRRAGFRDILCRRDLAGHWRLALARRP